MIIVINLRELRYVFSLYQHYLRCLYRLFTRICSEPTGKHLVTYLAASWRRAIYYSFRCDIGSVGKLSFMLLVIHYPTCMSQHWPSNVFWFDHCYTVPQLAADMMTAAIVPFSYFRPLVRKPVTMNDHNQIELCIPEMLIRCLHVLLIIPVVKPCSTNDTAWQVTFNYRHIEQLHLFLSCATTRVTKERKTSIEVAELHNQHQPHH